MRKNRRLILALILAVSAALLWIKHWRPEGAPEARSAALQSYLDRLAGEPPQERATSLKTLSIMESREALLAIVETLRNDPSPQVRVAAIEALTLYVALNRKYLDEALKALRGAAQSGNPVVESEARHVLQALANAGGHSNSRADARVQSSAR